MQLTFFVLLPSLIVFLFCLYVLGREDFVLIRRNVFLEQLFNIAFAALAVGLFTSRLVYVLAHPNPLYLNPLAFLVFPYYPGLSFIGGIIGGSVLVLYIVQSAKFPLGRLFDFLMISLLGGASFGYFCSLFLIGKTHFYQQLFMGFLYLGGFILCIRWLYPRLLKADMKDGTIALMVMSMISFFVLFNAMLTNYKGIWLFIGSNEILGLVILFLCLGLLIKQEFFTSKK